MTEGGKGSKNIQDGLKCCMQKGQWESDGEHVTLFSNITRTAWRFNVEALVKLGTINKEQQ